MSASTTTTAATTTTPATVPASQVIPFPLPWGNIPGCAPGCVPAGGMDALMKCYMDIKAAMGFIGKVMIDLINNDPAVAQAMIAAIEKSGSTLPTLGVTNGADAQPGQVGEWVQLTGAVNYAIGSAQPSGTAALGVLQPGDWDCFMFMETSNPMDAASFNLNPTPAGFSNYMNGFIDAGGSMSAWGVVVSPVCRALISTPSLIAVAVNTFGATAAGTASLTFNARRAR